MITTISNINVDNNISLDAKYIVSTLTDLQNITKVYDGMKAWVKDVNQTWVYESETSNWVLDTSTGGSGVTPANGFLYWDSANKKYIPYSDVSLADSNNGISRIPYSDAFGSKMVSALVSPNCLRITDNILTPFLRVGNSIVVGTDKTNASDPENFPGSIHIISGNDNIVGAIDPSFLGLYLYTTNDRCKVPFDIRLDSEPMFTLAYDDNKYCAILGPHTSLYKLVGGSTSPLEKYGIKHLGDVLLSSLTDGQVLVWDATNNYWKNANVSGSGSGSYTAGTGINISGTVISLTSVGTIGTYSKVTTDVTGRVTSGSNPTTLSGYGITDAAPISHVGSSGIMQHAVATTTIAGFMSAADKLKLDSITQGGTIDLSLYQLKNNKYTVTDGNLTFSTVNTLFNGWNYGTLSSNIPVANNKYLTYKQSNNAITFAYGSDKFISVCNDSTSTHTSWINLRKYNNDYEIFAIGTLSSTQTLTLDTINYKNFYLTVSGGNITLNPTNMLAGEIVIVDIKITGGSVILPTGWTVDEYTNSKFIKTLTAGNYSVTFKKIHSTDNSWNKINVTSYITIS